MIVGEVSAAKRLLEAGWNIEAQNEAGLSSIDLAAQYGHAPVIKLMYDHIKPGSSSSISITYITFLKALVLYSY